MHTIVAEENIIRRLRQETNAKIPEGWWSGNFLPCAIQYIAEQHRVVREDIIAVAHGGCVSNEEFLQHVREENKPQVKIFYLTIKVEVPESHPWIAGDMDGDVFAYAEEPETGVDVFYSSGDERKLKVLNWADTKHKVSFP